jgi:RNA polymerase sigma-70 factor (ECF subfamily)
VTADLVQLAQAGDEAAFGQLVGRYERELQVHCYRMLGSIQDAEDALQEALLAAWRGLASFEGRSSMRTWLYRIATNRCLNAVRSARRREGPVLPPGPDPPPATRHGDVTWLEPYPDDLLEGLADPTPGPDAQYEAREAISLAFVAAVQRLPPRQRAVLLLRDVLGFSASDAAQILDTTDDSVNSALKRARATLDHALPAEPDPPPDRGSPVEQELVERLTTAYEAGDVDGIVALFSDDAWLTMPPLPLEYQGREPIARFLSVIAFRERRTYGLVETRANRQLAFAALLRDPRPELAGANGLLVLTLSGSQIRAMTRFDNSVLGRFGLAPGVD